MTTGFSGAVARLFRSFRRHHDPASDDHAAAAATAAATTRHAAAPNFPLFASSTNRSPPKTTQLPSGFTRQVRHLVDYVTLLKAKDPTTTSMTSRRHVAVFKALDRIAQMLRERDVPDIATRAVPLNAAVEQLLAVWECVLQCLELCHAAASSPSNASTSMERLSACSSTSSTNDESQRFEMAARRLLALLVQQREFDYALMALGRGECNIHQNDTTRKRSIHDGLRPERDELRVSVRTSRRGSVTTKRPLPRQMPSKRDVSSKSDAPLCQLTNKYLDLHQTTLRLLQDSHSISRDRFEDSFGRSDKTSDRALLMQFLAVSYVRVPVLRESMLSALQKAVERSTGRRRRLQVRQQRQQSVSTPVRFRSMTVLDEVNTALFRWTQNLNSKCHGGVAPYSRDGFWSREVRRTAKEMRDLKFQRVFIAYMIDYVLAVGGSGGIDWKCIPGVSILKEVVLTMTETVYLSQLRAAEQSLREKQDASTGGGSEGSTLKADAELARQSFSLSTADDWTVGLFLKQTMRMLACNTIFINDWMMTILHNTNYMVSYHVTMCLRYLSQLMAEFPAFFSGDVPSANSATVDAEVIRQIFTKLLKSDHFEILRNTELFLMKHFAGFSVALRESLVAIFAAEFKRLFLHWNRDVRFCFYHMLLYLTYPGNRLVLGAKSDELLMGAAGAYLFEIPGIIRNSSVAVKWDAFDKPLCELIEHVNRTVKRAPNLAASAGPVSKRAVNGQRAEQATTTRASMTLRPKPSTRSSLSGRPSQQYARSSLSSAPSSARSVAPLNKSSSLSSLPPAPLSAPGALQSPPPPPVPAWIQELPFLTVQRSVQEYKRHVETYFAFARQISVHEPVPTPMLHAAKA